MRLAVMLLVAAASAKEASFDDDEAQCSSCIVTVAELLDSVATEKPSFNVKVGMTAGRDARTVDHRVSELRVRRAASGPEGIHRRLWPRRRRSCSRGSASAWTRIG